MSTVSRHVMIEGVDTCVDALESGLAAVQNQADLDRVFAAFAAQFSEVTGHKLVVASGDARQVAETKREPTLAGIARLTKDAAPAAATKMDESLATELLMAARVAIVRREVP